MLPQKFRPEWTGVVRQLTATAEQTDMLYGGCSRFSAFNMGLNIPANRSSRLFFTQPLTGILRSNRSVSNTGVFMFVSPSAYSSKSRFIERSPRTHFYTGVRAPLSAVLRSALLYSNPRSIRDFLVAIQPQFPFQFFFRRKVGKILGSKNLVVVFR